MIPAPSLTIDRLPDDTVSPPRRTSDEVTQSWLNAQCDMIAGTRFGIVLNAADSGNKMLLLAQWPHTCNNVPSCVFDVARNALLEQTVVMVTREETDDGRSVSETSTCFVATPLNTGDSPGPVVVLELPESIRHQQQAIIQLLRWGAVWFNLLRHKERSDTPESRLETVVKVLAGCLEHPEFDAAATGAVSELATYLGCTQVSLGLLRGASVTVCAISNSARVDTRFNLTRNIAAAMNESLDQGATLSWPHQIGGLPHVSFAQEVLARSKGGCSVLSTPLYDGASAVGALTLEREGDEGFDQECKNICETLAALLGPVLALKYEKEKPLVLKVLVSLRSAAARLYGPRHVALKLYTLLLLASVAFLSVATGDYSVTARARVEGSVMRVVTAPGDGYIASADRRAGDLVEVGELLARLDDRELLLQQTRLKSQFQQLDKEYRAAWSTQDRSAAAIVNSRKQQTQAELDLVQEQLQRTSLVAPFSGIVVSGDLSQNIGSPVESGQVLFEIAPLDDYRVVLEVDERDIGEIANLQNGALTLSALPGTTVGFTVNRIVPLSTPQEGRNMFEVQAGLDAPNKLFRPGMEGVGKIKVDQRKLFWVWTHELVDWMRLKFWTWIS